MVLPNGDVVDWGRHTIIDGVRCGSGPARYYTGEAAKVMRLVLKYAKR